MKAAFLKIRSKTGAVYIRCAVVIVLICMLLSAVLFYSESVSVARSVRKRVASAIDGYLTNNSTGIYQKLDDGYDIIADFYNDFTPYFIGEFTSLQVNTDKSLSCINDAGFIEYTITYPSVNLLGDGHLRMVAELQVIFPVRIGDTQLFQMAVPISITSVFASKY